MFNKLFGKKDLSDNYENERLNQRYKEEETDPSSYSVLIHFTQHAEYIHIVENSEIDGFNGITYISLNAGLSISGNYIYINELMSMEEVQEVINKYKLTNPIRIEHS
jgi:hypothetical protein